MQSSPSNPEPLPSSFELSRVASSLGPPQPRKPATLESGAFQPWSAPILQSSPTEGCLWFQGSRAYMKSSKVERFQGLRVSYGFIKVGGFQGWTVPAMKASKVEGFQAAGKALAVADDPMAVQWKGRAAQIATGQQKSGGVLGTKLGTEARRPLGYTGYTGMSREKQRWTDLVQKWRDLPPKNDVIFIGSYG